MPITYQAINTVTVGSGGAASISFSSIPSTYTDLHLLVSARNEGNAGGFFLRFNSDSGNNYSYLRITSDALGQATFDSNLNVAQIFNNQDPSTFTADSFSNNSIYIHNYARTTYAKSMDIDGVVSINAGNYGSNFGGIMMNAAYWDNTSAITTITLTTETGTDFAQYTKATLYGIKNS